MLNPYLMDIIAMSMTRSKRVRANRFPGPFSIGEILTGGP